MSLQSKRLIIAHVVSDMLQLVGAGKYVRQAEEALAKVTDLKRGTDVSCDRI